jgi:hypothetical protein
VLIRVAEQPGGDAAQQAAGDRRSAARSATASNTAASKWSGPRVSGELLAYGMLGLMLAIFAILIYLWFRFEWQFALGRHDRQRPRHRADDRLHVDLAGRFRPHQHRGAADDSRLLPERHGRDLRPHPGNAAALQENADAAAAERIHQFDIVALDHHPRHR